jgi:radical SAM superfamily enzyme YgiQ (UPF0313 family)
MKILFYNPATTQKRYISYEAIKGSAFFRRPNYDAMRLAYLSRKHDFRYYDERIENKPDFDPDLLVVNVPLNLSRYIASTVRKNWPRNTKVISYGFFPTLFPALNKTFADSIVVGDIANIWGRIIEDQKNNRLAKLYHSNRKDQFGIDRTAEAKYGLTPALSQLRTSFGCGCIKSNRDFCYENIIYKKMVWWDINEAINEVSRIRRKVIFLRDDDFFYDIDYALNFLDKCWRFKKMWICQSTERLFNHTKIFPRLRENGVRIIHIKEDWLGQDLVKNIDDERFVKEKKRQTSLLHNNRIACGLLLRLGFEGEDFKFYQKLLKFLLKIKIDMVKMTVQTPIPGTATYRKYLNEEFIAQDLTLYDQWMPVVQIPGITPQALYSWMEWLRDRFYSWDCILYRNVSLSPKLGIYNTMLFNLIPNLSYRNNFLEKVGYPP